MFWLKVFGELQSNANISCFYCFWLNNFWDSINHFFYKFLSFSLSVPHILIFIIICIVFQDVGLSQLLHRTVKRQSNSKLYMIKLGHVREHQKSWHQTFIFSIRKIRAFYLKMFQKIASSFLPWRYFDLLHRVMVINI